MDSVQLEFTYLLTSQLESQRLFFEEKLARVEQQTLTEVFNLSHPVVCNNTVILITIWKHNMYNQQLDKSLSLTFRLKVNDKLLSCYAYWTVHHLDSWIKIDQLDVTRFIISSFSAQHVSNVSTSILRSLRLTCWVISWVVLLCKVRGFSISVLI